MFASRPRGASPLPGRYPGPSAAALAVLIGLLLALASPLLQAADDEGTRFNRWLQAQWELTLQREPVLATAIGDPRYNGDWVDTSTAAWRADNRRELQRQLAELRRFERRRLQGQDRLSYDIYRRDLVELLAAERFPGWMQPLDPRGGMPGFLAQLGSGESLQPFASVRDHDDWLRRLAAAVRQFDGLMANLRTGLAAGVTPPREVMAKVLPQLQALAVDDVEQSLFWQPVKSFAETIPEADRERLRQAYRVLLQSEVLPAYRRLHDFLRDTYIPRARRSTAWRDLPQGPAWYRHLVNSNTTTALTPDAIHAIGRREVARIRAEMEAVRVQVGFSGDLQAFFRHLQDDPRYYHASAEALLQGYRELQLKINGLLPRLFDIAPKADYVVKEVEAFRAASAAGASYWGPSADGSRPGVFYVNTHNLKAQPIFGMETLSLHEASPGHHFQIAIAQELTTLPAFRRFNTSYVAYSEGWALYAESIGRELGLFTDPYQWFGRLSDEQLRAMRLVVDTGLHHRGWSRQQAIDYMRANAPMADSDIVAEVERYLVNPGQALGYKIGQLRISALRREAEQRLGARFDIKAFHRVVLADGALPMDVLATKVREWIAAVNARPAAPPRGSR